MRLPLRASLANALVTTALFTAPMAAQPNQTSKYLVLTTYHVKPAATLDFADFLKNKWMPAMKKGGASPRISSASPLGGDSSVIVISNTLDSFALYDNAESALQKGAGEAAYARMMMQRGQLVDSRTVTVLQRVPEMSVYRDPPRDSPIFVAQFVKVAPGKRTEFDALWKRDVIGAVKKTGNFVSAWRVVLGDETQYVFTTPLEKYADLDQGFTPAARSMDPAAYTAFNEKVGPMILTLRREVLRLRKDLMGAE